MTLPVTAQAAFAATVADEWARAGITDVVIAPGSRSTPLALAMDGFRVHVVLDERSAAFLALGIAMATGRPAPVITTSGTAAGHLLPAVMEAHHARLPMLVCTADRPPELHGVGAPQTVAQDRLFEGFLRWRFSPGAVEDLPAAAWRSVAARSVAPNAAGGPGPVHLNLGFRDPLVGAAGDLIPPGRPDGRPWHLNGGRPTSTTPLTTGATALMSGRTGLIVAGSGISDPGPVITLAKELGWPILAGPRSRCRGPAAGGVVVVSAFDSILRTDAERLRPEVVLRLGDPPASKVTNAWLAAIGGEQVVADPWGAWIDPDRTASLLVAADPEALCNSILANGPSPAPDGWAAAWRTAEAVAQQALSAQLSTAALTEPSVARAVTGALPADATLVVASSMPIRDVEWFGDPAMRCRVVANRGLNGIDGLVSATLGVAIGSGGRTVSLLGDLAFLHDSGGLLGAAQRTVDCTFVVIDNHGGGIFSFLPQATDLDLEVFERLFATPQQVDLAALAGVHGIPVIPVDTPAALVEALGEGSGGGVKMIHVRTDRQANVAVHDDLHAAVAAVVAG